MAKQFLGAVMFYPIGENPYVASRKGHAFDGGDSRIRALREFRDTGKLPDGFSLWSDSERRDITDPAEVDWVHMRE